MLLTVVCLDLQCSADYIIIIIIVNIALSLSQHGSSRDGTTAHGSRTAQEQNQGLRLRSLLLLLGQLSLASLRGRLIEYQLRLR